MKSFIRVKIVRGNEYLYEITPYYDSATGKVRQKSKYLGKKDTSGAPIPPVSRKQTSRTLSCGEYLPFLGIAHDLGLDTMLQSVISQKDTDAVMALAINLAARPGALTSITDWYDWTAISMVYPDADLRPAKIMQLLQNLSDFRIMEWFNTTNSKPASYTKTAALVTNIVREETFPFLREYCPPGAGPAREYFMILCDPDEGIISGGRRLPDTVRSILHSCSRGTPQTDENVPVIFPRGAITAGHLNQLAETDFPFVLPIPPLRAFGRDDARTILKAVLADLNFRTLQNESVYIKASPISVGSRILPGFIVLNAPSERAARIRHHHEIFRLVEDLKNITIPPGVDPSDIIRDIAGDLAPFVTWIPGEAAGSARIDRDALMHVIMEAGMVLVLHRGGMRREECMALLTARRTLNDILSERIRLFYRMMHEQPTERMAEGMLFIAILAAALRWRLEILLPRVKGRAGSSIDALMGSLCTITVTAGPGRRRKTGGAIRGQRSILSILNCMPDRVIPGCSPLPEESDEAPEEQEKDAETEAPDESKEAGSDDSSHPTDS
ncbi:MAG: hypothetical protein ABFC24_08315 [Methanoregulaceae archaeon]